VKIDQKAGVLTVRARDALIFLAAALFLLLTMDRKIGLYDEGLILTGAMRVATGEVPHRDFYANYGPAQFYIVALLFKVFGQSVLVERIYDLLVRATIVTLCYRIANSYCRRSIALVTAAACALLLSYLKTYAYPIFPVILLCLLGMALIVDGLANASRWRLLCAGATTGLAALFRYDVGFLLFVAQAGAITLWIAWLCRGFEGKLNAAKSMLAPFIVGTALAFLPPALCYLAVSPITPFVRDIFVYSVHNYSRMRGLPFPSIQDCARSIDQSIVYLPILVSLVAVTSLVQGRHRASEKRVTTDASSRERWFICLFILIVPILFLKGIVRVTPIHMCLSLIPSFILLAILTERAFQQSRILRVVLALICVWTLVATLFGWLVVQRHLFKTNSSVLSLSSNNQKRSASLAGIPRIRGFLIEPDDHVEAIRFLINNTQPNERIFVGLGRHDKIYINDNLTYFATGRLPATAWHQFDPGLQTSAEIQTAMVTEIEARAVRYIVLTSEWDDVIEPNESARSSGIHIIDDYIHQHYRTRKSFGKVSVMVRI
jgi:4-amino-4-deoxy-L-arabinose transferase-like glycosyltransferase